MVEEYVSRSPTLGRRYLQESYTSAESLNLHSFVHVRE